MSEGEILMTRKVEELAPDRLMHKMVLEFTVMGKPAKIHIEFKNPVAIDELPRTVLEAEEDLLDNLEAQIYVHKSGEMATLEEVASVREEDDEEDDEEE